MQNEQRRISEKIQLEVELPLYIELGKRKIKKCHLNLNNYRNWHFHLSNDIKTAFHKSINLPKDIKIKKAKIEYRLYFKTKIKRDGMNIVSVLSKFFLDSLIQNKIIQDDDYKTVVSESWIFAGYAEKDYCLAIVYEIN